MIKNFIVAGMLCFIANTTFAQNRPLKLEFPSYKDESVSPIVREKIEAYSKQINTIIADEKKSMEAELKQLNEAATANNWSKTELETKKAEVSTSYSEKINKKIEDLGFNLDEVIEKQVRYSLMSSELNTATEEELKKELLKKYKATKSFTGYISYGFMGFTNSAADTDFNTHLGYANGTEFGFKFNYQFNRESPWAITSGIGLAWRTVRLDNNKFFAKDNNGNVIIDDFGGNLDKSKLRTGYAMVPLGIQYNFSKLKNVGQGINYRPYYKGFKVGAQVYGGVRLSSNNIMKNDDYKMRERGNYQVNPFVYGAQVVLAYDRYSLFVRKDFSNFFKDGTFPENKMFQIGIGLGL